MIILFCTAHQITDEQRNDFIWLQDFEPCEFVHIKDAAPEMYPELIQCPEFSDDLELLADELVAVIEKFDAVILPIGSPAFQFCLARKIKNKDVWFSHSERVSVEKDGVKTSVFQHKNFTLFCI